MEQTARTQKLIGFDLDGVIIDHTPLRLRITQGWGVSLTPAETHPAVLKTILRHDDLKKLQGLLYDDPENVLSSELVSGAKEALASVKSSGIRYVLISRRQNPQIVIPFLKKCGIWPEYFSEENAFFVLTPEDKNKKAAELGVTHYVDDEVEVLEKLTDVEHKFLFDYLNIFPAKGFYTKVDSWASLLNHILL